MPNNIETRDTKHDDVRIFVYGNVATLCGGDNDLWCGAMWWCNEEEGSFAKEIMPTKTCAAQFNGLSSPESNEKALCAGWKHDRGSHWIVNNVFGLPRWQPPIRTLRKGTFIRVMDYFEAKDKCCVMFMAGIKGIICFFVHQQQSLWLQKSEQTFDRFQDLIIVWRQKKPFDMIAKSDYVGIRTNVWHRTNLWMDLMEHLHFFVCAQVLHHQHNARSSIWPQRSMHAWNSCTKLTNQKRRHQRHAQHTLNPDWVQP